MILIAFGSNLDGPWGSPRQTVLRAAAEMQVNHIRIIALSSLIETPPMGPQNQPHYVNAVAHVETHKSPQALMYCLHRIESTAGRKRLSGLDDS